MVQEQPKAQPGEDAPEVNDLALIALFLSIVWLFGIGSVVGLVLARRSLAQIRASEGREEGKSLAIAAIVAGLVGLFSTGLVVMVAIVA
jgi:uncharacterized membrane protein